MRKVLACDRCRKSKVKCRYDSGPPCHNCRGKSYEVDCTIKLPEFKVPPKTMVPDTNFRESDTDSPSITVHSRLSESSVLSLGDQSHLYRHIDPAHNDIRSEHRQVCAVGGVQTSGNVPSLRKRRNISNDPVELDTSTLISGSGLDSGETSPSTPPRPPLSLAQSSNNHKEYRAHPLEFKTIEQLIAQIPDIVLRLVVQQVSRHFPELAFVHKPTMLHKIRNVNPTVMGAFLDLYTSFYPHRSSDVYNEWLGARSFYVKNKIYAKLVELEVVSPKYLIRKPSIEIVQSLLVLTLSYWGKGNYFTCWMFFGNAVRMLQSLRFCSPAISNNNGSAAFITDWACSNLNELESETLNRTYWSSFVIDRITAFGKNRAFSFFKHEYESVPLPQGERLFAFMSEISAVTSGDGITTLKSYGAYFRQNPLTNNDREFAIFIKIYSIWGEINQFLTDGGHYRQSLPPWHTKSIVYQIRHSLSEWWGLLPHYWKWSAANNTLHQTLGTENIFTMINCLYHLNVIYINREFLPFLPHSTNFPSGPTEGPVFPEPPDADYWIKSSKECFESVRSLTVILDSLLKRENEEGEQGHPCNYTANPFYCFCAFVSTIQAMYGAKFHWMDVDHVPNLGSSMSLATCSTNMLNFLEIKQVNIEIAQNWYDVSNGIMDLYDFVSRNMDKAREMNLGRSNLRQLKNLVQPTDTGISPENVSNTHTAAESIHPSTHTNDATHGHVRISMDGLIHFLNEDVDSLQQFNL